MDKFQNQTNVIIYLDELNTDRIPKDIGQLAQVTDLTIQLTRPEGDWTIYPPLSWYETRELKESYRELPQSIGQLQMLKSLRLSNLDIHELPETIANLVNLEFLDVSMNKLNISNELPKLKALPNLKHLKVLGNHFNEEEMQEFKRQNPNIQIEYNGEPDTIH